MKATLTILIGCVAAALLLCWGAWCVAMNRVLATREVAR